MVRALRRLPVPGVAAVSSPPECERSPIDMLLAVAVALLCSLIGSASAVAVVTVANHFDRSHSAANNAKPSS
jgi:hypothetical protein